MTLLPNKPLVPTRTAAALGIMASEYAKQSAVEIAQAVIAGRIGIIEASVRLASLAHDIVPIWVDDEDFVVFGVLSSETDHLPTGSARQYWSATALAEADVDIARIEQNAREDVLRACTNVIKRFADA
jgi:hypothetical protein